MNAAELANRFDERLGVADFADLDPSANGLQVGDGEAAVDHVAVAVDAAMATIEAAVEANADVLCVHHGLIWDGLDRVTGRTYDRIAALVEGGVALYAAHLPLDAHHELGNAAGVADVLGLDERAAFGALGGETVGIQGVLAEAPVAVDTLADRLADGLEGEAGVRTLDFGPETIGSVGVVTGSGTDWVDEAAEAGLDAFVTGEGKQSLYHQAREAEVNVLLGGHYATETFGVRALADLAADWGLETRYLDWPTGF